MTLGEFIRMLTIQGYPQRWNGGDGGGDRGTSKVLAQSARPATVTGTTAETVLATIPVPAGAMGLDGCVRVTTLWSFSPTVIIKAIRHRLGGVIVQGLTVGAYYTLQDQVNIRNRGVADSQISFANTTNSFSLAGSNNVTTSVNTAIAQDLTITGALTDPADSITLEGYTVELLRP